LFEKQAACEIGTLDTYVLCMSFLIVWGVLVSGVSCLEFRELSLEKGSLQKRKPNKKHAGDIKCVFKFFTTEILAGSFSLVENHQLQISFDAPLQLNFGPPNNCPELTGFQTWRQNRQMIQVITCKLDKHGSISPTPKEPHDPT